MNTLKSMFMAVFLTVFAGSANAATYLGDVTNSQFLVNEHVVPGSFNEDYTFDVTEDQHVAGVASNWFILDEDLVSVLFDIDLISLTFSKLVGIDTWSTLYSTSIPSGGTDFFNAIISAGFYKVNVIGNAIGESGGQYALHGEFTAAPIPEPSVIALMLGGLGLVGFMARRRKAA